MILLNGSSALAQPGVAFHQSNLPFAALNYEIKDRVIPELRIGTDLFFDEISVEGVIMFKLLRREDFEFYGGLGARGYDYAGLVVPIGLNIYPLPAKKFGVHIEIAPIIGEDNILRGSWGIRYRFKKE